MNLFTYLSDFGTHPLPSDTHWGIFTGLAVIAAFLTRSAYKDLKRPERVPEDAGSSPRVPLFRETVVSLWIAALACAVSWFLAGGSPAALGLRLPAGIGGWVGTVIAVVAGGAVLAQAAAVARSEEVRRSFALQLDQSRGYDWIRPVTAAEHRWFQVMAVTAGITEEVIFRGFLIGVLSLWTTPWAAAALSVVVFVGAHVYQGLSGMRRILPISVVFTLIFLLTGSLVPVVVLHALVDVVGGAMMWWLREYRGVAESAARGGAGRMATVPAGAGEGVA